MNTVQTPVTLKDALDAASVHPAIPAEHKNRFVEILKDIGKVAEEIALFPVAIQVAKED